MNGPSYFQVLLAGNASTYKGPYKMKGVDLTSVTDAEPDHDRVPPGQPFADFNYVIAIPQTAPVPQSAGHRRELPAPRHLQRALHVPERQLNKQFMLVKNPNWTAAMTRRCTS